jgi:hypothetical protein
MKATDEIQIQLRDQLLRSPAFRPSSRMRELLGFLFERSLQGTNTPESVIRRELYPDAGDTSRVRVAMHSLRKQLHRYFENEGRACQFKVQLVSGNGYRLEIVPNQPIPEDPVKRLWQPYLSTGERNRLIFGQPVFFHDNEHTYIRDVRVNNPEKFSGLGKKRLAPSYHYLARGEVMAALAITRMLAAHGSNVEIGSAHETAAWSETRENNLILIGSPSTNFLIRDMQASETYQLSAEGVRAGSGDRSYLDSVANKAGNIALEKYAILTRRPGFSGDRCVTIISANHAQACEGVAEFLTHRSCIRLFEVLKIGGVGPVPRHFQVIFRTRVLKERGETDVLDVELVAWHASRLEEGA